VVVHQTGRGLRGGGTPNGEGSTGWQYTKRGEVRRMAAGRSTPLITARRRLSHKCLSGGIGDETRGRNTQKRDIGADTGCVTNPGCGDVFAVLV
jgi:hypothetical protein